MSLIIKGKDIPKSCYDCDLYSGEGFLCPLVIETTNDWVLEAMYKRVDECPLVEVPTPHGRLIDADEHIKSLRDGFCGERCRRNHDCFNCGIDGYIRIVENEPTVLEAEVSE